MKIVVVGLVLLSLSAAGGTMFLVKKFMDSESQNQTMSASNQETSEPLTLDCSKNLQIPADSLFLA